MALTITDFKKTSRTVDGRLILYPHQIRDDRYLAAISYAIDYYERMVGRSRSEIEATGLLEFFGDPKLARGIIACLGRSYIWHSRSLEEILDPETYAGLQARGLTTPTALRAHIYAYANLHHHGYIPTRLRATVLGALCAELPISPAQLETLLTLDAPGNAVLVKLAGTPDARQVVALYNYHSLETPLRHAESLSLTLRGPVWSILRSVHNIARRYDLAYYVDHGASGMLVDEVVVTLSGSRDALGGFRRTGRRIVRALLRLFAVHPDAPSAGEAVVHMRGRSARLMLDKRSLRVLGAHLPAAGASEDHWEHDASEQWRTAWSRAFFRGETGGWRLRTDPEPIITRHGVVVPDFGLQRGLHRGSLILAQTPSAVEALVKPIEAHDGRDFVVVVTAPHLARRLSTYPVVVVPSTGVPSPRLLTSALPAPMASAEQHVGRWQRVEQILAVEKFVDEARLASLLNVDLDRVEQAIRGWRSDEVTFLPGIGLCTQEMVDEIRSLLQGERRRAA